MCNYRDLRGGVGSFQLVHFFCNTSSAMLVCPFDTRTHMHTCTTHSHVSLLLTRGESPEAVGDMLIAGIHSSIGKGELNYYL